MKLLYSVALSSALLVGSGPAALAQEAPSPYKTDLLKDGLIIAGLAGLSGTGLYLVQQKHGLKDDELPRLSKNDVPQIDRFSAGYYSESAQTTSDFLCYGSLVVAPGLLGLSPGSRHRFGQVLGLYVETVLTSEAIFTLSVGNVYRYRPYLYGPEGGSGRSGKIATNSFFSGHTANAATATFFAAKVFNDFNPDSPARPYVWGAAAVVPAVVAYYRVEAGKHFLTDNILGYVVGATMGVVVPQLHKKSGGMSTSVMPVQGRNVNGYSYSGLMLSKRL